MTISKNKVLDYTIVKGSLKTNKFSNFIKKINKNTNNKYTLFMDNATIHKSKVVNQCIKDNNIKVIYNVPYHSEYNPIEYIFSLLRKDLQQKDNTTESKIIKIINEFKINITQKTINNIFNKTSEMINKCI